MPDMPKQSEQFCQLGLAVIQTELAAIEALKSRINQSFTAACKLIMNCKGRVVVTGMGKSGHIAGKIAATLASTGTPAFFVHPGEANHGDMGMVMGEDVVIAISNSGETPEILSLLPLLKHLGAPLIALTGNPTSTVAQIADAHLDVSVEKEACPLGLAPTSSTTATLVMGDALAVALLEVRGFTADDFARFHPGGALGRRLLLRVRDLMHQGDAIPRVTPSCLLPEALVEITRKRLGMTTILNDKGELCGIFTDGDLRRTIDAGFDIKSTSIQQIMTKNCTTAAEDMLAAAALKIMQDKKITSLVILDDAKKVSGIVHMHDILRSGVN